MKPKCRIRCITLVHPIFDPHSPNEVWSADFKGQFRMGNGRCCYPLTIADSYNRYLFAAKGMHHPTYEGSMPVFEAVFRDLGLPQQIHTDNGVPFASAQGLARLTRMAVRFIDLGIDPVYSDPAHPEQNGHHERMHLELKGGFPCSPAYSLSPQQCKLNSFLREYNELRPHKALDNSTPTRVQVHSPREYPNKIEPWIYPKHCLVCCVSRNAAVRWKSYYWIMVATPLAGKYVGVEELGDGIWRVFYRYKLLGYPDEETLRTEDEYGTHKRGRSGNRV